MRKLAGLSVVLTVLACTDRAPAGPGPDGPQRSYALQSALSGEIQITDDPSTQILPAVSGTRVVWHDNRNGNTDVYLFDAATGLEVPVVTDPAFQGFPDISGERIVWVDNRNGGTELYMLNLATGLETPLLPGRSGVSNPAISGTRVVYDVAGNNRDIFMIDLTSGVESPITTHPARQEVPKISGNRIVWSDLRNGNYDVFLFDLSKNEETQITDDPGDDFAQDISGDLIVWSNSSTGQVYFVDIRSRVVTTLGEGRDAAVSGNLIACSCSNGSILVHNVTSGVQEIVRLGADMIPGGGGDPDISGALVVWVDSRNGNTDIYAFALGPPTPCANVTQIPQVECEALVALYNATNGDNWTNKANWLQTDVPCGAAGTGAWFGITCLNGRVTRIILPNNKLSGSIPEQLGDLAALQELALYQNRLIGSVPAQLGNLGVLDRLLLYTNQLSGPIPFELGNLTSLRDLSLADNQLTADIPAGLGSLTALSLLDLSSNQLSGSIPVSLGDAASLHDLYLFGNQLTGLIPSALGGLANLERLLLNDNQINGSIPAELGNLSRLTNLDLSSNQLTGSIPTTAGNLTSLRNLRLHDNKLSGSIPSTLGNLPLSELFLQHNQITGPIPPEIGNLSNLQTLLLNDNQLSGLVPLTAANLGGKIQQVWGASGCRIVPSGNTGLYMPDITQYRAADLDGDGRICGLGFTATPETVAADLTAQILALRDAGVLNGGQASALIRKIDQALKLRAAGKFAEAIGVLSNDFIPHVNSFMNSIPPVLTAEQGQPLIELAQVMIELIRVEMNA